MQRALMVLGLAVLGACATGHLDDDDDDGRCGDRSCGANESAASCPSDCAEAASCGDRSCNGSETINTCPADCGGALAVCGDAMCNGGETSATCPADCVAAICGDANCNGTETETSCPADCSGGGGGGSGSCAHDECATGAALTGDCSACAQAVCADDAYCCDFEWDSFCVDAVDVLCAPGTCGGGGGCAHDECSTGVALDPSCSSCTSTVCALDSYCCDFEWDSFCVDAAYTDCAVGTCP